MVASTEYTEAPAPAYAFVDEEFTSTEAVQREFCLGGDYGSDASGAEYLGPVGMLAVVINAPGEAASYQRAFEEREITAFDFMAIMARETAEARVAEAKAAGAKLAGFFGRLRDSLMPGLSTEHKVSEGVIAQAAGAAATRRAIALF